MNTPETIPTEIASVFSADPRIVRVHVYASGWVPNSYHWPAPGAGVRYERRPEGWITDEPMTYDRKRPYGKAPRVVGYSAKGGRLYSA